jgi:hypothetical protein
MADKEVMVFAVSQFSSVAAALHPAPPVGPRPKPEDLFNALDTGSKGYLTQTDLQSAIVKISDQGAKLSAADAQAQAQEIFSKLDKNGDGKATLAEFKQAAPDGPPGGAAPTGGPPGGPPGGPQGAKGGKPPGGGPRGAGGGGAAQTNTTYDPADTNRDGVVSDLERLAYTAKHMSVATQAALKTYQSVSQNRRLI